MMLQAKKIMIIAGEVSGDQHAAHLVKSAIKINPQLEFFGVGGAKMRAVGVDTLIDCKALAVVGITQVIRQFKPIYQAFKAMEKILKNMPPDLLVLVDYPGFNLRLAKVAKKYGVKVFYYISPQVWAWRQGRVHHIKKYVDQMAVIFPFEEDFYKKYNIPAQFVGHPLSQTVFMQQEKAQICEKYALKLNEKIIGLCPGSRHSEIKLLMPVIMQSAKILKEKFPQVQFVLPLADSIQDEEIKPYLQAVEFEITIVRNDFYHALGICDAIIIASGTATLEATLLGIPMAIIYKASFLTYLIAKMVVKVDFLGIANIIAGREISKEFLQFRCQPHFIAAEIEKILSDKNYQAEIQRNLAEIKQQLGKQDISVAAELLLKML